MAPRWKAVDSLLTAGFPAVRALPHRAPDGLVDLSHAKTGTLLCGHFAPPADRERERPGAGPKPLWRDLVGSPTPTAECCAADGQSGDWRCPAVSLAAPRLALRPQSRLEGQAAAGVGEGRPCTGPALA